MEVEVVNKWERENGMKEEREGQSVSWDKGRTVFLFKERGVGEIGGGRECGVGLFKEQKSNEAYFQRVKNCLHKFTILLFLSLSS